MALAQRKEEGEGVRTCRDKDEIILQQKIKRRATRARFVIELGGKCMKCGSTDRLEFDHINSKSKKTEVCFLWGCGDTRIREELKKCQLLCHTCHKKKHGLGTRSAGHGTLTSYVKYHCRCEQCKGAQYKWGVLIRARRVVTRTTLAFSMLRSFDGGGQ